MELSGTQNKALERVVSGLRERLEDRLVSLILYGSSVRGNVVDGVSDLNLLIVLRESRPEEHAIIGEAIRGIRPPVEPFIVGIRGFERSCRAFAVKIHSIARHYHVLHGADALANLETPLSLRRFLAEQSLRNLWLRLAHLFATHGDSPRVYARWLIESTAPIFTDLCEPLRLEGFEVDDDFAQRTPVIERFYEVDASVLIDLLALRARPRRLSRSEVANIHARLFTLLDHGVGWIEAHWPVPELD